MAPKIYRITYPVTVDFLYYAADGSPPPPHVVRQCIRDEFPVIEDPSLIKMSVLTEPTLPKWWHARTCLHTKPGEPGIEVRDAFAAAGIRSEDDGA